MFQSNSATRVSKSYGPLNVLYNSIIVFISTDVWAPVCIFLHVSGQNESVPINTKRYFTPFRNRLHLIFQGIG